jgi:oxaloacetate decarboxylase gamma subunit
MLHQMPRELLLEQVSNGLILMLLGMGVVFVFLTLLVFLTKLLSLMVRKYLPEKTSVAPPRQPAVATAPSVANSASAEVAAAITAAVAKSKQ